MKQPYNTTIYNTELYMRLSRDDENYGDSVSIETQRTILQQYAKEQGLHVVGEYVDDGWSGTNFERPDFQRMMDDVEAGKVNCIVTKDDCVIIERKHRKPQKMRVLWCPFCFRPKTEDNKSAGRRKEGRMPTIKQSKAS